MNNFYGASEYFLLARGDDYFGHLKEGLTKSKILNYLDARVDALEKMWGQKEFDCSREIANELILVLEEINFYDMDDLYWEAVEFAKPFEGDHPTKIIERAVEFFGMLVKWKRG